MLIPMKLNDRTGEKSQDSTVRANLMNPFALLSDQVRIEEEFGCSETRTANLFTEERLFTVCVCACVCVH